jgi:hypothetical protein
LPTRFNRAYERAEGQSADEVSSVLPPLAAIAGRIKFALLESRLAQAETEMLVSKNRAFFSYGQSSKMAVSKLVSHIRGWFWACYTP